VLVRLAPTRSAPSDNQEKSLRLSLAYPDEAAHRIQWAYRFCRTGDGWVRTGVPTGNRSLLYAARGINAAGGMTRTAGTSHFAA
jgi:hypothetical protein